MYLNTNMVNLLSCGSADQQYERTRIYRRRSSLSLQERVGVRGLSTRVHPHPSPLPKGEGKGIEKCPRTLALSQKERVLKLFWFRKTPLGRAKQTSGHTADFGMRLSARLVTRRSSTSPAPA